jgi:hypothetical protein
MSEENKIEEEFKIDENYTSKFDTSAEVPVLDAASRTASDRTENLVINPWQRGRGRPKAAPETKSSKGKK